jgi:hypothetical protein
MIAEQNFACHSPCNCRRQISYDVQLQPCNCLLSPIVQMRVEGLLSNGNKYDIMNENENI